MWNEDGGCSTACWTRRCICFNVILNNVSLMWKLASSPSYSRFVFFIRVPCSQLKLIKCSLCRGNSVGIRERKKTKRTWLSFRFLFMIVTRHRNCELCFFFIEWKILVPHVFLPVVIFGTFECCQNMSQFVMFSCNSLFLVKYKPSFEYVTGLPLCCHWQCYYDDACGIRIPKTIKIIV